MLQWWPPHVKVPCARQGGGGPRRLGPGLCWEGWDWTVRCNASWVMVTWDPPPVDRMTDRYENITFDIPLAGGKYMCNRKHVQDSPVAHSGGEHGGHASPSPPTMLQQKYGKKEVASRSSLVDFTFFTTNTHLPHLSVWIYYCRLSILFSKMPPEKMYENSLVDSKSRSNVMQ